MKKSCWLILPLVFSFCTISCKKSTGDSEPTNYNIDGIHDVTVAPNIALLFDAYLSLDVKYKGNVKENVTLSLEGLPSGCTANIDVPSANPPFEANVTFDDVNVAPGTYPVKLVCQGSRTGMRSYTFNMIANPDSDYTTLFLGTYSQSHGFPGIYTITVTAGETMNKIYFNNFDNAGNTLYGFVKASGEVNIPQQTVNNAAYSGIGHLLSTGIQLNLEGSNANGPFSFDIQVYK